MKRVLVAPVVGPGHLRSSAQEHTNSSSDHSLASPFNDFGCGLWSGGPSPADGGWLLDPAAADDEEHAGSGVVRITRLEWDMEKSVLLCACC